MAMNITEHQLVDENELLRSLKVAYANGDDVVLPSGLIMDFIDETLAMSDEGKQETYDEGYDDGFEKGKGAGYDDGYDEGYDAGHLDGIEEGKWEAFEDYQEIEEQHHFKEVLIKAIQRNDGLVVRPELVEEFIKFVQEEY